MGNEKLVYFFGDGTAEGDTSMKQLLGGKGANIAEMINLGVPVPPGFTLSTRVCELFYENDEKYPESLSAEVDSYLDKLEKLMGKKLGDKNDPLLVSVRSGAAVSMPGMMDTILNLGLNDQAVEGMSKITGNPRFVWDAYRRFIQMFGNVALGMDLRKFESVLKAMKKDKGVKEDTDLSADDLKELVDKYKKVFKSEKGEDFPQDPKKQLWSAIDAVFGSWNNASAIEYRSREKIRGLLGTAVNVQCMVFGNFGDDSGTGVCFSRDPSDGTNEFYGEYLMNAQGEDVVAGIRTPNKISNLEKQDKKIYDEIVSIKDMLEEHYKDMQDMEFTIQQGKLYFLQTRSGKRTGKASVKIAMDLVAEGVISKEDAITRVSAEQLDQLFHPLIEPSSRKELKSLAEGITASPGAATGRIVFDPETAQEWVIEGEKVLLVREETNPEDIGGMYVAEGILTATGGKTSHAAVVARGMGTPCVAGCKDIIISGKTFKVAGSSYKEGDWITIDGTTGEVFEGKAQLVAPKMEDSTIEFLSWCDEVRNSCKRKNLPDGMVIRTNADQPVDAIKARELGAEGIGLCRTEHMFFDADKLEVFQEMIVSGDIETRRKALAKLLPLQKKDFIGIFEAMEGLPVTVRLLDPPLHEFLPTKEADIKSLAKTLNITVEKLNETISSLHELNPMLGHRGCRLGITYPEIYDMQVEAIISAAIEVQKSTNAVYPEIMIPLIGTVEELTILRKNAIKLAENQLKKSGSSLSYSVGTMIEIPRAALTADEIATQADFFSFGTNDLTQMTFGFSRDDIGSFLPSYLKAEIFHHDPFASIDKSGVGRLVAQAVQLGRTVKPNMKMGVCGEHGGDPRSIDFFYKSGLSYVSCSPFRVPIARLAVAQSVINSR